MKTVRFRCPHCHKVVEIPSDSLGTTVACPEDGCGLAFSATPPAGELVGGASGKPGAAVASRSGVQTENTLFERHPAMFRKRPFSCVGLWTLLIAGSIGLVSGLAGTELFGLPAAALMIVSGALALSAAAALVRWWISVIDTKLVVTSERTILRNGLLNIRSTEVLHEDVRNLQFDQSFTDRLLNVGDLALSSSGQDDLEIVVSGIPRPHEIVEAIRRHQSDD